MRSVPTCWAYAATNAASSGARTAVYQPVIVDAVQAQLGEQSWLLDLTDGTVYVAQSLDPAAYAVNPATGVATLVGRSPLGVGDNIAALPDGRVLLSAFTGGSIAVFTPSAVGYTTTVRAIGG